MTGRPEPNMPTSTPEFQQKTCTYCQTVAAPLATQCGNCGANLPTALPRPVARLVEAQSRWSMGKTALVSLLASLGLGAAYNVSFLNLVTLAVLTGFWFVIFLPVMLVVSAIMSAGKDAGRFFVNLMIAGGLWFFGGFLTFIAATLF